MANVNPSPKARFHESKDNISKHRDLIASREFERAIDFALLEYQRYMAQGPMDSNVNQALAGHYKQMGAVEFVHILKTLAEEAPIPPVRVMDQLDHRA
jgi:hypothetical protein